MEKVVREKETNVRQSEIMPNNKIKFLKKYY